MAHEEPDQWTPLVVPMLLNVRPTKSVKDETTALTFKNILATNDHGIRSHMTVAGLIRPKRLANQRLGFDTYTRQPIWVFTEPLQFQRVYAPCEPVMKDCLPIPPTEVGGIAC